MSERDSISKSNRILPRNNRNIAESGDKHHSMSIYFSSKMFGDRFFPQWNKNKTKKS
jgi:hypothetical protein